MKVYRGLIYKNAHLLDPFIEEEHWIYRRVIKPYFIDKYGLDQESVWKLVNDKPSDYQPLCPVCGKPIRFDKLSRGYYNTCSTSCSTKLMMSDPSRKLITINALNSPASQAKGRFTQFMKEGDESDPCVFYIAKVEGSQYDFKYGVTSKMGWRTHCYGNDFSFYFEVINSTRINVATIERDLKLYLNSNHESFYKSDIDIILDKIYEFIDEHELRKNYEKDILKRILLSKLDK